MREQRGAGDAAASARQLSDSAAAALRAGSISGAAGFGTAEAGGRLRRYGQSMSPKLFFLRCAFAAVIITMTSPRFSSRCLPDYRH